MIIQISIAALLTDGLILKPCKIFNSFSIKNG